MEMKDNTNPPKTKLPFWIKKGYKNTESSKELPIPKLAKKKKSLLKNSPFRDSDHGMLS